MQKRAKLQKDETVKRSILKSPLLVIVYGPKDVRWHMVAFFLSVDLGVQVAGISDGQVFDLLVCYSFCSSPSSRKNCVLLSTPVVLTRNNNIVSLPQLFLGPRTETSLSLT